MSTVCVPAARLLTRDEAAEFLGVSPQTLANWASTGRGELPYIRVSARAVRYRLGDIENWARNRTITHTGQADAAGI